MPKIEPRIRILRYGMGEDFTPIGALRAGAETFGIKATYPWLMGISGAAFRIYWSLDWSLDIANYVSENVVDIAAKSVGLEMEFHLDEDSNHTWELVKRSIDSHNTLISCGLVSPFESCLITGYEESPRRLYIRGYLDEGDEYPLIEYRPWFGWCHNKFGRMPLAMMNKGINPDIPTLIRESLQRALKMAGEGRIVSEYCKIHRTRHVIIAGLDAFLAWAGAMVEDPGETAAHRGFATSLNINQLIDSRTSAQNYMLELCNRVRPSAMLFSRAAEHYAHVIHALKRARELIPYPKTTPDKVAKRLEKLLKDDKRREQYAKLLRTAREEDAEALVWIRKVYKGGIV